MNLSEPYLPAGRKEILEIFENTGALLRGHFLLTSGHHSNVYFQCAKVLQYPEYAEKICGLISDHYHSTEIDTVIAPAIGGIIVGQEVARQLNKRSIFAEREDKTLSLRRGFSLEKGEKVLVCEDVVTTGGSVFEVIDIVKNYGAEVVGVGYIVDRSNGKVNFSYPQFSTIKLDAISFSQEECPLCKEGIELVKPGSRKIKI
ncbi:MAG: orotate phosphoribosyltransferase [Ignavibacteria bacterium RBG_16_34_14]|nr:MAG: orotate phosphoribosyltransferase [Ignavibacteria bacterium RBG_16_34_14]